MGHPQNAFKHQPLQGNTTQKRRHPPKAQVHALILEEMQTIQDVLSEHGMAIINF